MSLAIRRAQFFIADFEIQFAWYVERAGEEVAWRFHSALDLRKLAARSDLGRARHFRNPKLQGLRSYRVEPPFNRLLILYRAERDALKAVRLMHGSRDLPRRLTEPPEREP